MAFHHTDDVRSVLLPATLIYWFVGMGVFEYPIGHPRRILSFFYSFAACAFHAACAFFSYVGNSSSSEHSHSRLISASYGTYYGANVIIVGFIIVVSVVSNKNYFAEMISFFIFCGIFWSCTFTIQKRNFCVMELEDINRIIKGMGIVRSYKPYFVSQMWHFGSLVLITGFMSIIASMSSHKIGDKSAIFCKIFCLQYPYFISSLNEIIFCNFNQMMTGSFEDLNSLLESLRVRNPNDSQDTKDKVVQVKAFSNDKLKIKILYSIRRIHTRLARLAKHWNEINSVFILALIVFSVWIFTIRVFAIYIMLSLRGIRTITETYFIDAFLEIIYFSWKLFMITRSAVSVTFQARRTCDIILKHLHPIACLRLEVRTFSMQLICDPFDSSVLGVGALDYSMLQQITSMVATYLVMLIQTMGPLDGQFI